jgi:hypothetical protein
MSEQPDGELGIATPDLRTTNGVKLLGFVADSRQAGARFRFTQPRPPNWSKVFLAVFHLKTCSLSHTHGTQLAVHSFAHPSPLSCRPWSATPDLAAEAYSPAVWVTSCSASPLAQASDSTESQ